MFVMDMPDLPLQLAQVIIVQASQSQQTKSKIDRTIGVCQLFSNVPNQAPTAANSLAPLGVVAN